jgi:hypothetical protein
MDRGRSAADAGIARAKARRLRPAANERFIALSPNDKVIAKYSKKLNCLVSERHIGILNKIPPRKGPYLLDF